MEQPTTLRIRQHNLYRLLPPLERLADSRDRPSRPSTTDKSINTPIRLLPDLRSRPFLMRSEVGEVLELVGEEAARWVDVVRGGRCGRSGLGGDE